jgi:hypothetical protein
LQRRHLLLFAMPPVKVRSYIDVKAMFVFVSQLLNVYQVFEIASRLVLL